MRDGRPTRSNSSMFLSHLQCTETGARHDASVLQTVSLEAKMPLEAIYDLERVRAAVCRDALTLRPSTMWKYREVLPLAQGLEPVSLGEGGTPLVQLPRLGAELDLPRLEVKDEGQNPTGSFKARGMSAAVSMAKALGATALAAPSAGNAGGALAAYGARAGLPVHLAMPRDVPASNLLEATVCGAHVELIDGNISDCGAWIRERCARDGWFDLSTLKEPYRVEGKKTMGYELCEQLGWTLPDVILYPAGGGTGLVGMWKAFHELRELGWLDAQQALPRMVVVQASGCAPIVDAFHSGATHATPPSSPHTVASGLRVPKAIGDRWMLRVLRESNGTAIAIDDADLVAGSRQVAASEGVFFAPEAGALVAACAKLRANGFLQPSDRVTLFNTGTGLKYGEVFAGLGKETK